MRISSWDSETLSQGTQTTDKHRACWSDTPHSIYSQSHLSVTSSSPADLHAVQSPRAGRREVSTLAVTVEGALRTAGGDVGTQRWCWTCSSLDRFLLPGGHSEVGNRHPQCPRGDSLHSVLDSVLHAEEVEGATQSHLPLTGSLLALVGDK